MSHAALGSCWSLSMALHPSTTGCILTGCLASPFHLNSAATALAKREDLRFESGASPATFFGEHKGPGVVDEAIDKMSSSSISGAVESPKVDVVIDMGHPFLNRTVDGFLKIGSVAGLRAVAEDTYNTLRRGTVSKENAQNGLKKMCKEGAYWGTIAGAYVGMQYGMEQIRGKRDWKNALLGGAAAGALVSAVKHGNTDRVMQDALTGGALATAAEFLGYLT